MKLIIDCDTGIDDSLALLYALATPEAEVIAVTSTAGNIGARQVATNNLALLELCGRPDIEVALGREVPLVRPLMIAPELFPLFKDFTRPKFDPDGAKKLLTEAGYPDGFEVTMDCPNDRYVNDAAICQAIVGMLARIGVKINLLAQPKAQYFAKVLKPGGYQTSFFLLGWTPGTLDSHNVLFDIMGCRDDPKSSRGEANLAGYCNKKLDELADQVLQESDTNKRDLLIKQAFEVGAKDFGYIPLHQQALAWGVSKKVKLSQRADNQVLLYWATKQD